MVGSAVLRECLLDPEVESVVAVGRQAPAVSHEKLRVLIRPDMFDVPAEQRDFAGYDACFFCLGVSSVGKSEAEYTHLTYELTMKWAQMLARVNPAMRFLYVSGMGTGGKAMWARVKGRTENELLALFPEAIMIRLGALRPTHGERPRGAGARALLTLLAPLWPLVHRIWSRHVITTEALGRALIRAAKTGSNQRVLESADLVRLGQRRRLARRPTIGRSRMSRYGRAVVFIVGLMILWPLTYAKGAEHAIRRYLIVQGDSTNASWDTSESPAIDALRSRFGDRFAWFRKDGHDYVITDSGVMGELDRAMEPQKNVNRMQAGVNREQGRVNEMQSGVNAHQHDVNAMQAEVNESRSDAGQERVNRKQAVVNTEQAGVNAAQAKVNAMQEKVNEEQHRVSAEFNRRADEIFDSALQRGVATRLR